MTVSAMHEPKLNSLTLSISPFGPHYYQPYLFQTNQHNMLTEVPLVPIYRHSNANNLQEQKPFLTINSLRPNTKLMQQLYDNVCKFIQKRQNNTQIKENRKLVRLIQAMNYAKKENIHEELMGQFAYNKSNWDSLNPGVQATLLFTLLKKYNVSILNTNEMIPLHFDTKEKTNLTKIINTAHYSNTKQLSHNIDEYQAFFQLTYDIRHTLEQLRLGQIRQFATYLYGAQTKLLEDYSQGSYSNLENEFYTNAYHMLLTTGTHHLYHLIQMIEQAKKLNAINNESDLSKKINGLIINESIITQLMSIFDSYYEMDNAKKRITLFCKLAEKYNTARGTKTTPTVNQYQAYEVKKTLNITLPDSCYDKDLFDDNIYAFDEFKQLLKDTAILIHASEEEINQSIGQKQYQKKT